MLDFLWLTRRHSLVKPAELISHDENERQAIETVLSEADGDLVTAFDTSRERALARQILLQRKLKGEVHDLLDIIDLCVAYSAPELESFTPAVDWHHRAVTEKQIAFLRRLRVDVSAIPNRGHASAIIDVILRHNERLPATPKQVRYLCALGYRGQTSTLSRPAAARLIGQLKNQLEAVR